MVMAKAKKKKSTSDVLVSPPGMRVILTHEVAKYLGMSAGSVRTIALQGRLKSYKLSSSKTGVIGFDWEEVQKYKRLLDAKIAESRYSGQMPGGFKPDTPPYLR
jgi:hypothetical protein